MNTSSSIELPKRPAPQWGTPAESGSHHIRDWTAQEDNDGK